jgi:hypothetical protein
MRLSKLWPSARTRRRWVRRWQHAPLGLQVTIGVAVLLGVWLILNGIYQVVRKPSELFFPISGMMYRTPAQTWDSYQRIFRKHSTPVMTPELLAAIAQVEGSGNPIVRTYWRWSLTHQPFEVYRPASSAVGMYQITNGTFAEARRYCIHDHAVVADGPWYAWRSCWFNSLYTRVLASHSVELTSAYLHHRVARAIERARIPSATLTQKQRLAAIIHLCGASAGERYAQRGFRLLAGQRCGDHDVRRYLARIEAMQREFARLGAS